MVFIIILHPLKIQFHKYQLPVKYPSWEYSEPCRCPDQEEDSEDDITGGVELGVVEHLGQLQEYIGAVVGDQDQRSTPATAGTCN